MAGMMLHPVQPHEVEAAWRVAEPFVVASGEAVAATETPLEWRQRLDDKRAQIWLLIDADRVVGCVITEIYDTAKGKTCALPITAGDGLEEGIPAVLSTIAQWAREQGCERMEGVGRKGWVRALRRHGWREIATVVEATL